MSDERIVEWARRLLVADIESFCRARRRFLSKPTAKRLHALRTAARRLRSLLEDTRGLIAICGRKRLTRLIEITGDARDATVQRKILHAALDPRERMAATPLMRALRQRERRATREVCRAVRHTNVRLA